MSPLIPALETESSRIAVRFGDDELSYAELASAARQLTETLAPQGRVAVWATPTTETAVAVAAAVLSGVPVVPLNPRSGERELAHIVADSQPGLLLAGPGDELPDTVSGVPRADVAAHVEPRSGAGYPEPVPDSAPGLIVYTSGTTGSPKGVVLSRRALAANLDALAEAWHWTEDDTVVHALPLFHVHGLVLGLLGPLRLGGTLHHLRHFSAEAVARALPGGTVLFGVPTMYHRLADAVEAGDQPLNDALSGARLLVSGSAPMSLHDHERLTRATGARVIERYGMTETLMNTAVRPDGPHRPGTVGTPLPGVDVRLVDDDEQRIEASDGETVGEIQVRGRNLFTEYLGRPDATTEAFAGGWFRTGDMAVRDSEGAYRIVGRRSTDLIKSGGHRIGAGEIENALRELPGVADAAVTGEPDPDLGERIVAWVVRTPGGAEPAEEQIVEHVARQLSEHKRPRAVRFLDTLPRNDMGKVLKRELR